MFFNCYGITILDFTNFDTSSVTDMCCMFWYCNVLSTLDLSGWDKENITDFDKITINPLG